ncbi:hypothetical protein J3459_013635 [Metarhizium acridum]|nr:hypothetical protein J3459_013635 [Metarhizium acridum]
MVLGALFSSAWIPEVQDARGTGTGSRREGGIEDKGIRSAEQDAGGFGYGKSGTSLLYGFAASITDTSLEMSVNDVFFAHQRDTANGIYAAAVMGGSFLAPMTAGIQAEAQGWRVSYTTLAGFMTAINAILIFLISGYQ